MYADLLQFLYMGGYGGYVFSAYGSVIVLLFLQWFIPWRRWRRYAKQQRMSS
jgi:heme exporter protein CcmD